MVYNYALINDAGRCYEVYKTTAYIHDKYHVPIDRVSIDYLFKYYYPMPDIVVNDSDFCGEWYFDVKHQIKEVPNVH